MSILQEILEWSKGLPTWQSDAISRLLLNPILTNEDIDDLFALLKLANGIADPKNRTPNPLTADQIPAPIKTLKNIELRAIKNLLHVNAIASNQNLPINPSGLTVIYGDNGSGKSGYSRVLKRACRARDQAEPIHPNANLPSGKSGIAEAIFEVAIDDVVCDLQWTNGKIAPTELSSLSIFDSRCARAYLDSEDDFSYIPYGLDIFEGLAKTLQTLKNLIEIEHAQNANDLSAFAPLIGDSEVGKLISSLSANTSLPRIEALANLTTKELTNHTELEKSLKENNPKEKANQLRLRARRIENISKNATNKGAFCDESIIEKLRTMSESYRSALAAATLAATKFIEAENLLPGTGGEAWKELFEAARKFAIESHPDKQFPDLGEGEPCPLCQQPLAEGSARLIRFETFIQQEAEKTSKDRRVALFAEYKPFTEHDLNLGIDDITYGEIESIDPQLAADSRTFESSLVNNREIIKAAVLSNDWKAQTQKIENPATRLQVIADKLNVEAEGLEKASDEKARATLQKEFNEIDARLKLSKVKDAVLNVVSRLIYQSKLNQCLLSVRTNNISLKASELAEKVVSKELAEALNNEFKALSVNTLQVSLQSRSHKGKALHKLKLELPQSCNPTDILSEGEQRAIALGSFLAEVKLSGGTGGIVFDDPVSSLDPRRRERVAKRLALEAKNRQVIIFTHDIYFLSLLAEEAKLVSVPIITQSLMRRPEGYGVTNPELPFEGKSASKRIGALKAHQQEIAKLHKLGSEEQHRYQTIEAYSRLRMTWERAVEEVLLREVVVRFRKGIETQRLAGVIVDDDDYSQVYSGMTKCSNYTHDKAMIAGAAVPDPEELLMDINTLEAWREKVDTRSRETVKTRKN